MIIFKVTFKNVVLFGKCGFCGRGVEGGDCILLKCVHTKSEANYSSDTASSQMFAKDANSRLLGFMSSRHTKKLLCVRCEHSIRMCSKRPSAPSKLFIYNSMWNMQTLVTPSTPQTICHRVLNNIIVFFLILESVSHSHTLCSVNSSFGFLTCKRERCECNDSHCFKNSTDPLSSHLPVSCPVSQP